MASPIPCACFESFLGVFDLAFPSLHADQQRSIMHFHKQFLLPSPNKDYFRARHDARITSLKKLVKVTAYYEESKIVPAHLQQAFRNHELQIVDKK